MILCFMVMNKDHKAIGELYSITQKTEFMMCHLLNKRMPTSLVERGVFFEMQTDNQYNKNDIVLIKISPERQKKLICKVEFEYGITQENWDFLLPDFPFNPDSPTSVDSPKWNGLNLMERKQYGDTFSLFIKSSPTYKSFFAVDCRDNFVVKNFGDTKQETNHSLNMVTNNTIYKIYWGDVPKHRFMVDENKKLTDGNLCIIEYDDWSIFYSFLWRRFLK